MPYFSAYWKLYGCADTSRDYFFSHPRSSENPSKPAATSGEGGDTKENGDCKAGGDTGNTPVTDPNGMEKKNNPSAMSLAEKGRVEAVKPDIGNGEGEITTKTGDGKKEEEEEKKEVEEEEENVMNLDGIQLLFDIEAAELIPLIIRWVQETGADRCN